MNSADLPKADRPASAAPARPWPRLRQAILDEPWRWTIAALAMSVALGCLPILLQPEATAVQRLQGTALAQLPSPYRESADWEPPAEGERRAEALDDLRHLRVGMRSLHLLQQRYVEPVRFRPRLMLESALQAVAHLVPEMLVDVPERDAEGQPVLLRARIGEVQKTFDLHTSADLHAVGWHLLQAARFVADHLPPDVPADKVEYTAINGVLSTLDPYSRLLDPDQWRDMQTNTGGNFGGLGIVILPVDGVLTIQSVLPGSPAEGAGLQPGDQIQQIDGEDTLNMTVDAAVERLRGTVGTTARLVVRRKGEPAPQAMAVVRAVIHLQSVESKVLDNGVGYARVKNFQRGTAAELGEALDNLLRAGAHPALVIDLRDNPGGLLDEAIRVCDLFIGSGPAVTTVSGGGKLRDQRLVTGNGRFAQMPLAVLINGHSASASEVVAGALKYSNRALVVGEQSFGKGSVQVPYEIEDAALKLTVAKYLVPGDVSIHGKGITPDIGLQFVSATREQVSLFGGPHYSRATRKARAALESQPPPPPPALFKVLLPDATDRDRTDTETPAQVLDREPRQRAAALLRRIGRPDAKAMLTAAQTDLQEMARADDAALIAHLKRQGIDWRRCEGAECPAASSVPLRVEIVDGDRGLQAQAGEILRMAVTLTNLGKQPLHRLHLQTRCDDPAFDDHEQLVGRLEPGQSRTVPLSVRVSIRHGDLKLPLIVAAAADGALLGKEATTLLTVRGKPLPEFAFRVRLIDPAPVGPPLAPLPQAAAVQSLDGILQPGEGAMLAVEVENRGAGMAQAVVVRLRSLSGQRLHLGEGKARVGPLPPQMAGSVQLALRGVDLEAAGKRQSGDWEPVRAELAITDETLGVERIQVIDLPWARRPLKLASTQALQRLRAAQSHLAGRWDLPPRVDLIDQDALLTPQIGSDGGCWFNLSAVGTFEEAAPQRRFVTFSVGGDKQAHSGGLGRATLPVHARLRLDSGLNAITILAQAGPRRGTERTVLVHCAAAALIAPADAPVR